MPTEITVNTGQDFQNMLDNQDFTIAQAIVESILENINTKKRNIHVISVNIQDEDSTFDITLDKEHFAQTLKENLPFYIKQELYEDCTKIQQAIQELESKKTKNKNKSYEQK